jgi:hypothetical protein
MSNWTQPGSAAPRVFFKPKDHSGELIGFKVKEFKAKVDTGFKNKEKVRNVDGTIEEIEVPRLADMVWADITVFTGPNAGRTYTRAEVSAARLVRQLKDHIDEGVLGRLFQSDDKGEPWELAAPTKEDFAQVEAGAAKKSGPFG